MGVRLIVEALDYAPDTLTPRERYVLVVLAESARDATRVCWPGIEDDETFIRRSRLKSRSQRYAVIKGLVDKGALESVKRGNRGSRAVYRIARLAPAGAVLPEPQEAPETAASLAAERVPESRTQSGGKGPGSGEKGSRNPGQRVPESRTPSPHVPSESPQSDARAAVISELAAATGRTVDDEWATKVAKQILESARGDVASPVAYVVRSIRAAADDGTVSRFLPTPGPDRFAPAGPLEEVLPPRPDPVMETAACGHLRVAGDDEECWLCAQEAADAAAGDAPQQPAAADSDCAADPGPGPDRPTLTVHPGGNRPPRRGRDQPPLLTAVDGTPDTPTTPAPGLPPELAARLARHRAGFAGRTRGATA